MSDGSYVYWGTRDGVVGRALATGGPASVISTGLGVVDYFTADGTSLFYTTADANRYQTLFRRPIGGGASVQLGSGLYISSLVHDATHLYLGIGDTGIRPGMLLRVPK